MKVFKNNEHSLLVKSFGIKDKYTSFVLPFGATVNKDGTSVYLTVTDRRIFGRVRIE